MGYWLNRIVRSRRIRVLTLAGIGLMSTGACGGAMLANYTVSGMSPFYGSHLQMPDIQPRASVADWAADEALGKIERDGDRAQFADPWKPQTADYQPE